VAVEQQFVRLHATRGGLDEARSVAAHALLALDPDGDDLGRCRAWRLRAWIDWTEGLAADADAAWQRAAEHATRADDARERFDILGWRASAAAFGPLRATAAIRLCAEIRDAVGGSPVAVADTLRPLALLQALIGDFSRARELAARANAILDELHRLQSVVSHHEGQVELLADDPVAAEACLRRGYERLADLGEQAVLATTAAMLAQAILAQGRYVEALAFCDVSERSADEDDLVTLVIARHVRARVLAERGAVAEAEAVARDAIALASRTDALVEHGDAQLALAAVLDARGDREAAAREAHTALELYERKGALVPAARARAWLQTTTASGRR
jgi:tetratricopeptide (TPR) repeat protein